MSDAVPALAAAPRKRRRLGRRLLFLLLFLVLLVGAAPFALSLGPVRRFVEGKVADALGRPVTIGALSATWWSGVEAKDVVVGNPAGYAGDPLLAVGRIHADVAVLRALGGSIDATVVVERPVLTILRGREGGSNLDGFPKSRSADDDARPGASPRLRLTLRDGRVVAHGLPGGTGAPDVVEGIEVHATIAEATAARVTAKVRGARAGGGDVPVALEATLAADGSGPVKVAVPALDLQRVAHVLAAMGIDEARGAVDLTADVSLAPGGGGTGLASLKATGLSWTREGGRVALTSLVTNLSPQAKRADGATPLGVEVTVEGLRATGFSRKDGGLDEPRLTVKGVVVRDAAGAWTFGDGTNPLAIEGRAVRGSVFGHASEASASLAATLSPTLGRLLGLVASPDDDLRGTLTLAGTLTRSVPAPGREGQTTFQVKASVADLVVGGGDGSTPWREPSISVDAEGAMERGGSERLVLAKAAVRAGAVSLTSSPGFTATLPATPGGTPRLVGSVTATADLAAARALVARLTDLAPQATLSGALTAALTLSEAGPDTRVTGTVAVDQLRYVGARDPATGHARSVAEPRIELKPNLVLGAKPGTLRLDDATIASTTVSATVRGSVAPRGDGRVVDLEAALDGDLSRVAEHLRRALGPSYDDAVGEGRLRGTFSVAGATERGGRDLRLAGDLTFERLASGGLSASNGKILLTRTAPGTPLTLVVTSAVNGGTLRVDGSADLGPADIPWRAKVAMRGVDTSPLLTGKGAAKALTLVLPAIVPSSATTAVLSGRLDADLDVSAASIEAPRMMQTLAGPGSVKMTQGQVRDSTLFSGLAGPGAGKGMELLGKVVPAVGKTIGELSRALLFTELSSVFTIGGEHLDLNPVVLVSPSADLRFTGRVGLDGRADLDVPLRLGGSAGKAVEPYLKDRTIPLTVTMRPNQPTKVTPRLDPSKLSLEKGKDLLEDLLKRAKPR